MMGSRGQRGGFECEALSHKSRRLVRYWRPGAVKAAKRTYWKRKRKESRQVARTDGMST
jgi:hypothetical protein